MGEPDLNKNHTNPHLFSLNHAEPKSDGGVKMMLNPEIIMKLRNNAYNGRKTDDAVNHITRFLQIIDLVKDPDVDIEQLHILTFPYSLTGEAQQWWVYEGNSKITSWVEIWLSSKFKNPWKLSSATKNALWNFWEKGYDNDTHIYDEESSDDESDNSDHRLFFHPYLNNDDEGEKNNQMMHNNISSMPENFNIPHSDNDEQQNEGTCRVEKFEVIKYSVGNNEEFLGVRSLEHNS
ncbi:hypothetical protein Tco_1039790 [Tanacetum coccineum]